MGEHILADNVRQFHKGMDGEIGFVHEFHMLNAYYIIMNEENVNRIKKGLNIMNEGLCLAGLSKNEEQFIQADRKSVV